MEEKIEIRCPKCKKLLQKINKNTIKIDDIVYCPRCEKEISVTIIPERKGIKEINII